MNKHLQIYLVYIAIGICFCLLTFFVEHKTLTQSNGRFLTKDCGHGDCVPYDEPDCTCDCDRCYVDNDGKSCSYQQKTQLVTFLLSFFVGEFGADWFYLARGNSGYIVAGVFKLLTIGGLGIWWLVDWIRVLNGTFADGNHRGLCDF